MASITNLSRLFSAIASEDIEAAREVAAQIAMNEEEKGHTKAARLLRGSLNPNGTRGTKGRQIAVCERAQVMSEGLAPVALDTTLRDVVLRKQQTEELNSILKEWSNRKALVKMGIPHRTRLLFHGPPGCGKSFAAKALGNELSLPTYVVRFDSIIGAYLGQTALHLRELFRFAESTPCVLLFDEIDALGKQRGNPLDVGELDRIVIALMQELEFCQAQGLVIATTNLPVNLDKALWRRFDASVEFPKPNQKELVNYAERICRKYAMSYSKAVKKVIMGSISYAAAESAIESLARRRALRGL